MKPRTLWVPKCLPEPPGWHYCMMTACLVNNETGSQITDQWIEALPRLLARERPDLSQQWFYPHCMRAGLDPADLYHDTGQVYE